LIYNNASYLEDYNSSSCNTSKSNDDLTYPPPSLYINNKLLASATFNKTLIVTHKVEAPVVDHLRNSGADGEEYEVVKKISM